MNRRDFLHTSLALPALGQLDFPNTAKTYRVALIGCGWYGTSDLLRLIQVASVKVVGLCDVDEDQLAEADRLVRERTTGKSRPRHFTDYQKMLDKTRPEIVLIGTPDHWHALPAIAAIKAGAHLYLQKPTGVDVRESEAILDVARQFDRKVQVGTQRRSTPHFRELKRTVVDAGLLGEIGHVEMCCYYHMRMRDLPELKTVPAGFDYDAWSGPAPLLPFRGKPHRRWRARMEYGNGIVGDMCVHMLDAVRWLLGLGWPGEIYSTGGINVDRDGWANTTDTQTATFAYPGFNCVWQHRTWGPPVDPDYPWALFIYGSKGTLKADVKHWEFTPTGAKTPSMSGTALYEREKYPEDVGEKGIEIHAVPATRRHLLDLVESIEEDRLPVADIEEGHISTASCVLANMAMSLGRPLTYDPERREVINDPEATALLAREYREGYAHPGTK